MFSYAQNYVKNHKKEIMSLYSTIYTLLEFEAFVSLDKIDNIAAYYTMMLFLYNKDSNKNRIYLIKEIRKIIKEAKVNVDNQFHNDFIVEIKNLAKEHEQRLIDNANKRTD